jgi:transposase InsO family protein
VIRTDAGMTITGFAELTGVPRRTYTRRRGRWLAGEPPKGPWPAPTVERIEPTVAKLAEEFPAWGHRKIWALHNLDHPDAVVSQSSVRRAMARRGLLQPVDYQRERREIAKARRAAFVDPPTHRNQVWQLDFSEFETTAGGTWRLAGCRDYFSKYEHPFHISPTANQHDAIDAVELALADHEALFGRPLAEQCRVDEATGEVLPVVTIVTDNGGPFRSFRFESFIAAHPELAHVRTRVRTPGQNGSRERGFGMSRIRILGRAVESVLKEYPSRGKTPIDSC